MDRAAPSISPAEGPVYVVRCALRAEPDDGRLLMYDLADVLESVGEHTRALTVCLEPQAGAGDYRDVADRMCRLTAIQIRG